MNTKSRRAFITGVYGQDGSYLAEYLLERGYEVLGLVHANDLTSPSSTLFKDSEHFSVCIGDVATIESFSTELDAFEPDEIYNLAAVSDLKTAREKPEYTYAVNYTAFKNLVAHAFDKNPAVKIFQALSSRILTPDPNGVITESSKLSEPQNAYDRAKRDSYEQVVCAYRKQGFFITSGFLCNHESPRRDERFVTGKIVATVARITEGTEAQLVVGNVYAKRDWSFARDVVRGMHAAQSASLPRDYVIGGGELHTVKEFIDTAFTVVGMPITWSGEGVDTQGHDASGTLRVLVSPDFYQVDDNPVVGDTQVLMRETGWQPETTFQELVTMMVTSRLQK